MAIQAFSLNTTSLQDPSLLTSSVTSRSSSSLYRSNSRNSFIDMTIPDNRLFQNENGEIILIPKTPAEVFGERVLRPLIDGVYSLASRLFSGWNQSYPTVEEEPLEKADAASSLRSRTSFYPTSIDSLHFDLSETSFAKVFFAMDELLARYLQWLPAASAYPQQKRPALYDPNESPQPLDEVVAYLKRIKTCQDYLIEMSAEEGVEFTQHYTLLKACSDFAQELANVRFDLVYNAERYELMKANLRDNCLATLSARTFFEKEKERFESGQSSLFSHPEGTRKGISAKTSRYIQYRTLEEMSFRDLNTCKPIVPHAENLEEETYFEFCNPDSDRIFAKLRKELIRTFEAFSSQNIDSVDQMELLFHVDSIKQLTDKVEEILIELDREGFVNLERIIITEHLLERDVFAILGSSSFVLEDDADCDIPPPSPKPDIVLSRLALAGVILISVAMAACFHSRRFDKSPE